MKLIAEIYDEDKPFLKENQSFRLRKAARALATDKNGMMPIIHVKNKGIYKLPGGGVDEGEVVVEALEREILEEVGALFVISAEVGITIEYRAGMGLLQISYIYTGKISGKVKPVNYTEKEIAEGCELLWVTPKEAKRLIKKSNPQDESARFIVKRDNAIMKYLVT